MDYLINKNYIATVLCENLSAPEKHCQGKCHLKKELDKDSNRQNEGSQKSKTASEVLFFGSSTNLLELTWNPIGVIYFQYLITKTNGISPSLFRPPSC